jgi:hypothetical protein
MSRKIAPPSDAATKVKSLVDLERKYTMESEREVHRSYTTSGADGQGTPLDPALSRTGEEDVVSIAHKADTPGEFGDNVELF